MKNYDELRAGFETAYIDGTIASSLSYRPQFISNDFKSGKKVLTCIEEELNACDRFRISVAFITMGGVTPLLQTLKELEEKNIPGEILTTNYLDFTEPEALDKLHSLRNITLKMYDVEASKEDFHTKGYIFKKEEIYRIVIGSSNMTGKALTCNREWNTKIISTSEGEYAKQLIDEYDKIWNSPYTRHYEDFIDEYRDKYSIIKHQREIAKTESTVSIEKYRLTPNSMQVRFISRLKSIVEAGENRALLISATGTGKTYASAFAMREMGFKRVLFLVHRGELATQTIKSYKRVFDDSISMGMLGCGRYEYDADYVFAMVPTLNRDEHLSKYAPDAFDAIIIDEAHHSSADSYKRVMNWFTPKLWLGMTATPDKRDDNFEGRNVYEIFNHQIAYEIRLQQAMEENLLCPFHYFGIHDVEVLDEKTLSSKKISEHEFNFLTRDERVERIIEQAKYYGYSGNRVKGLVFCSRVDESQRLSDEFNKRGYRTIALNGDADSKTRQDAFSRLAMDDDTKDGKTPLDYIFSVDILNEGVDIVEVNQVIMLRPTQSPIVFIQQLGRGLRKAEGKEYVVVLDFIGNYNNNFMIPIALSGDRSYNKDSMRKYVQGGTRIIPGPSTVHFDEVSRTNIFRSIDKMNTTGKMLVGKYNELKEKIGRIPTILDFYEYGEIDPMLFIEYSKTYDQFVRYADKDYKTVFSKDEEASLLFVSSLIANGKRPHELLILRELFEADNISESRFNQVMMDIEKRSRSCDYKGAYNVLSKQFTNSEADVKKYGMIDFLFKDAAVEGLFHRTVAYANRLMNPEFALEMRNLIEYGLLKYKNQYIEHDEDNLVLYEKYSRKDVCRLLNWEHDDSSTMYGYRIKYNTCPIFVTYEKSEDITATTNYADEFNKLSSDPELYDPCVFDWWTRNKVSINSSESQQLIHAKENNLKVYLFLKKSDGEGTDFYYMGKVTPESWEERTISDGKGHELPIMNFKLRLEHEARKDLFDYFTS